MVKVKPNARVALLRYISKGALPAVYSDRDEVDQITAYAAAGLLEATFVDARGGPYEACVLAITRDGMRALSDDDVKIRMAQRFS